MAQLFTQRGGKVYTLHSCQANLYSLNILIFYRQNTVEILKSNTNTKF